MFLLCEDTGGPYRSIWEYSKNRKLRRCVLRWRGDKNIGVDSIASEWHKGKMITGHPGAMAFEPNYGGMKVTEMSAGEVFLKFL